jgi:hypothetical protein
VVVAVVRRHNIMPTYRWRVLTDEQDAAINRAYIAGARVAALAAEYHVHKRTIYRSLSRSVSEQHTEVVLGDWSARFALTNDGPIQTTAWRPTVAALRESA